MTTQPSPRATAPAHRTTDSSCRSRIGVVVIGRNEGKRLYACLRSIGDVERVVYVDSGSTDASVALAEECGAEIVQLSGDIPFTAARARNAGARRLIELNPALSYIQFVDGDCELLPTWLSTADDFLNDRPDVAVVCGRRYERYPERSIYNAISDREWDTPIGQAQSSGGDALVRISAYLAVGGFADDQIAHEEPEFCSRLRMIGWQIWRIDAPMTRHDAAIFHLNQFLRRSRRAGLGISQAVHRTGGEGDDLGRAIIRRSVLWAMVLPLIILLALWIDWRLGLVGLSLYAVQWLRNGWSAWRSNHWSASQAGKVSAIFLMGKFAEAHGIVDYWLARIKRERARVVYQK